MKKRDRRELERYVRHIANEMGLRDWTFAVDVAPVDGGRGAGDSPRKWAASNWPVPGRKFALLTFAPERRADSREAMRHTVVHELVHCHFFPLWDTLIRDMVPMLDTLAPKPHKVRQALYDAYLNGVERQMEYGVDAVAEAIAPRMPLIEWPS